MERKAGLKPVNNQHCYLHSPFLTRRMNKFQIKSQIHADLFSLHQLISFFSFGFKVFLKTFHSPGSMESVLGVWVLL